MFEFFWPWIILVLPLAFLVRRLLKPAQVIQQVSGAIYVPFFDLLKQANRSQKTHSTHTNGFMYVLIWILLVIAGMRPLWWGDVIPNQHSSHNIMLALDVSGSMAEQDFDLNKRPATRLQILKAVSDQFVHERAGDNLGLVIFGSEAYTYAPLSPDTVTLRQLLSEIGIGIAGTQTAIGEALALSVQGVSSVPTESQIVILMSDGYSNAGRVSVSEAIQLAKGQNIKVYTVGIGSDAQMIHDFFGSLQVNPSQDLDEKTLQAIAQETGGRYFRAKSTQELAEIYQIINQLEPIIQEKEFVRPRKELFFIPLLIAMILFVIAERKSR